MLQSVVASFNFASGEFRNFASGEFRVLASGGRQSSEKASPKLVR